MKPRSARSKSPARQVVKDIRRKTRRHFSAESKIRIVVEGLRGDDSIAELCRHEGIPGTRSMAKPPNGISAAMVSRSIPKPSMNPPPSAGSAPSPNAEPLVKPLRPRQQKTDRTRRRSRHAYDDLEAGEVGLPHLVGAGGAGVERLGCLDQRVGRAGDEVVSLQQPVSFLPKQASSTIVSQQSRVRLKAAMASSLRRAGALGVSLDARIFRDAITRAI